MPIKNWINLVKYVIRQCIHLVHKRLVIVFWSLSLHSFCKKKEKKNEFKTRRQPVRLKATKPKLKLIFFFRKNTFLYKFIKQKSTFICFNLCCISSSHLLLTKEKKHVYVQAIYVIYYIWRNGMGRGWEGLDRDRYGTEKVCSVTDCR